MNVSPSSLTNENKQQRSKDDTFENFHRCSVFDAVNSRCISTKSWPPVRLMCVIFSHKSECGDGVCHTAKSHGQAPVRRSTSGTALEAASVNCGASLQIAATCAASNHLSSHCRRRSATSHTLTSSHHGFAALSSLAPSRKHSLFVA